MKLLFKMDRLGLILSLLVVYLSQCYGYIVTVDAHAQECFFEKVEAGTKLGLSFQIAEGGFLDIDVKILDPNANILYTEERQQSGKYSLTAHVPGVYTFCFSNIMSTMTPKIVMFDVAIGEPPKKEGDEQGDSSNKLEEMIRELSASLTAVKQEQEYMQVRDRIHRSINESTNSRVVAWSFFEAVILFSMTVAQVFYLKRFFEVRRVV